MDDAAFAAATERGMRKAAGPHALSARYARAKRMLVIALSTGAELHVPAGSIQGLEDASAGDLSEIEVSPVGMGLHFPRLDADVYVPALLEGVLGAPAWAARALGATGGKATSERKAVSSRANGKLGGRPRKAVA